MATSGNVITAMTVREAAKELQCSAAYVRDLLAAGKLRQASGVRSAFILLDAESVMELHKERRLNPPKRGRPRKTRVSEVSSCMSTPTTGIHAAVKAATDKARQQTRERKARERAL